MARTRFPDLSVDAFVADTDRIALEGLKKVPILPTVIRKFHEGGFDRWFYCWNMASSVRCGPKQYGTLYAILQESCQILDMPEPELYVSNNPFTNAFAGGIERPYITVRSSMIDALDDEQLFYLMGHELGHIKAGHVLYKTMAMCLIPILRMLGRNVIGLGTAAEIALVAAFYEWSRQAEVTCDRAGLLCAQDFNLCAESILHITGGPSRLRNEASVEAFLDQARSYTDMEMMDSIGKMLIFLFYGMQSTHPFPVHRVQILERWVDEGKLERILQGNYAKNTAAAS